MSTANSEHSLEYKETECYDYGNEYHDEETKREYAFQQSEAAEFHYEWQEGEGEEEERAAQVKEGEMKS